MKCRLNNYWWKYPKYIVCEGSIITQEQIEKLKSKRNGSGFWQICDGEIEIDIQAVDEPYYGGSSAELRVEFRCNKCGNSWYPERNFPQYSHEVNEWINKILKEIK